MADALAIRDTQAFPLREPVSGRRYTLVRLQTENGLTGWGECGGVTPRDLATARQALADLPATAYEIAWRRLANAPSVRAAVDMAMLELAAQHSRAPVYQFLGGPTRHKVRAMAPLEGAAALERAQNAGFRAFSVAVPQHEWRNAGKGYVSSVATLMQRMRQAAGQGNDFVLDGGGRLVPGDAQSLASELSSFHLLWFDEPCSTTGLGAVKKIASENVTPLGFGRTLTAPSEFQDLLREDCVDIVRPHLHTHGITGIRRIAALAEVYYIAVAPFHDGGPVATAAALHLAASLPNFFVQQIPVPADPKDLEMRRSLLSTDVEKVSAGYASLINAPGWGVTVNQRAVERYQERG